MTLDFTPLKKALTSLSEAIASTTDETFMSSLTISQQKTMKAGVIQNFEFTYELSWKMLLRQLTLEEGREAVVALSRKDLYRLGAKKQLLDDVESWFIFHRARNETSHTYDENTANAVYRVTLQFLPLAQDLWKSLEAR